MDPVGRAVAELDPPFSALVQDDPPAQRGGVCRSLLGPDRSPRFVVIVTSETSPHQWVHHWERVHEEAWTASLAFVHLEDDPGPSLANRAVGHSRWAARSGARHVEGDTETQGGSGTRSHHGRAGQESPAGEGRPNRSFSGSPVRVETVDNPRNLGEIGVRVNRFLTEWAALDPCLCVEGSALLRLAAADQAFRFFHYLTGRVRAVDGTAHVHASSDSCDPLTMRFVEEVFDTVVRSPRTA